MGFANKPAPKDPVFRLWNVKKKKVHTFTYHALSNTYRTDRSNHFGWRILFFFKMDSGFFWYRFCKNSSVGDVQWNRIHTTQRGVAASLLQITATLWFGQARTTRARVTRVGSLDALRTHFCLLRLLGVRSYTVIPPLVIKCCLLQLFITLFLTHDLQ